MDWSTGRGFFTIAVLLYGLSAVYAIFLLRKGFRQDNRINYLLLLCAFGFQTAALFQRGFSLSRCPVHNLYEATVFIGWTIVGAYLLMGTYWRLRFLGAFASPLLFGLGVFALMPDLDKHGPTPEFGGGLFSLHVALFALSYGALGLSSVAGLMYVTQEHDLKFHKLRAIFSLLPPIERLELITGRLLLAGFVLLSAGLTVSLMLFRESGGPFNLDPKILWSFFVWILCFMLVVMRWKYNQGGRRFAWGAIGIFVFVMLTFWGSSLISPIHSP